MVYNDSLRSTSVQNNKDNYHVPVLIKEVLNGLDECIRVGGKHNKENKIVVDTTAGGMGHSSQIASRLAKGSKLICIDKDADAIKLNKDKVKFDNVVFVNDGFENIKSILKGEKTDAILCDLGVSSYQIDTPERGFSYMKDGVLDMRMNQSAKRDAAHVVNNYSFDRLYEIIKEYGEEKFAKSIASAIVAKRPIKTTGELSKIIVDAVPGSYFKTGGHPAKRTFQAIRIEVNRELEILEGFIRDAVDCLNPNGRIAIITFHSLEDRIVKQTLKELATDCICPPKTPKCICNHHATVNILTKKPIEPTAEEIKFNPRAASAKLRIAEKREEEKHGNIA
jgi:16S rRNA (cytosine1402-N4)-methyltransferase